MRERSDRELRTECLGQDLVLSTRQRLGQQFCYLPPTVLEDEGRAAGRPQDRLEEPTGPPAHVGFPYRSERSSAQRTAPRKATPMGAPMAAYEWKGGRLGHTGFGPRQMITGLRSAHQSQAISTPRPEPETTIAAPTRSREATSGGAAGLQHAVEPRHEQQAADGRGDVLEDEGAAGALGAAVGTDEDTETCGVDGLQRGQVEDELAVTVVDGVSEQQSGVCGSVDVEATGEREDVGGHLCVVHV
jgi:hypothetical protein